MSDRFQHLRLLEAVLFAFEQPVSREELARFFPDDADLEALLEELATLYANRGVNLVRVEERWALRTAPDLAPMMKLERPVRRKLSRAAIETLAIIAYHQPVTRTEIEEIRGVGMSKGTLDTLLEAGWIKPKGRRRTPGRPVTWGTTLVFLDHFGLENLDALPGQEELKAAGLLDKRPAITALGRLPGTEDDRPDSADEDAENDPFDEDDEAAAHERLETDFGEDLVAADDVEGGDLERDDGESDEADPDEPERLSAVGPDALEPGGELIRPMSANAAHDRDN